MKLGTRHVLQVSEPCSPLTVSGLCVTSEFQLCVIIGCRPHLWTHSWVRLRPLLIWEVDSQHDRAGERYVRVRDFGEHDSSDSDSESDDEDDAPDFAKVRAQARTVLHGCRSPIVP